MAGKTCQWLEGAPSDRNFCGKPALPRSSWCEEHHQVVFASPPKKEGDVTEEEFSDLDTTLSKLQDCDLSAWDQDFVDDMVKRVGRYEEETFISGKQWEQIERMKGQYL